MAHYTHIEHPVDDSNAVWEDIVLSSTTKSRRNQLKVLMDEFCTFRWRDIDAFEVFGAFIVNSKNLKFYNGPSFSNQYTKPQFESSTGTLTGVTFNTQQISFTVGVYWISEDHYRRLIYWLHPYEINTLAFGFDPEHYYQVKLAKIGDSTRSIVGYEGTEPRYYTELSLTFEIQGPNCAYNDWEYEFESNKTPNSISWGFANKQEASIISDLAMPFKWYIHLDPSKIVEDENAWENIVINLSGYAVYNSPINDATVRLFEVNLKNLVFSDVYSSGINIVYDSETSLLFLNHGDSANFLLSHLLTSSSGKRIVNNLSSQQYSIPGRFEDYTIDLNNWKLELQVQITSNGTPIENPTRVVDNENRSFVEMRGRTNII